MINMATLKEKLFKDEPLRNMQTPWVFAHKTLTKLPSSKNKFVFF